MLPTLKSIAPLTSDWLFEIKYDGFRAILDWDHNTIHLWSRNEKDLLPQFPEIKEYLLSIYDQFKDVLPLIFDGELVVLENEGKANFGELQKRGRMKSLDRIQQVAYKRPCTYLVFDLLTINGNTLIDQSYLERKKC